MVEVRELNETEAQFYVSALAEVLVDCVDGGASVNFMAGFTQQEAETFFRKVVDSIRRKERVLLAAFAGAELVGTVQIVTAMPPNQPHRAEIAKLLVKRSQRGKNIGILLMKRAEELSLQLGKTLLVLDTVTGGAAEQLYLKLGWTKLGSIPDYCLFPDGRLCGTSVFFKKLVTQSVTSI